MSDSHKRETPSGRTVVVLGAGAMGTAFTFPLCDAGCHVLLVGTHLDDSWIRSMQEDRRHPRLKAEIPAGAEPLFYGELGTALGSGPALVVAGVSSPGIDWAIEQLRGRIGASTPVLLLTKGLALVGGRITTLTEYVHRRLRGPDGGGPQVGGVGGPCIAAELAVRRESSVMIAGPNRAFTNGVADLCAASYYHTHLSTDVTATEAAAALKNFYTLGIAAGAGMVDRIPKAENAALNHNAEAAVFAQALVEMRRLIHHLGGHAESCNELAAAGDLYVTCRAGRNSRMGRFLGQGLTYSEARRTYMADETIEGADLASAIGPAISSLHEPGGALAGRLPLAAAIASAICDDEILQIPRHLFG
jgi:glycerol-3-phosphate dehydrogenase (NAD(P)+)